MTGNAVTTVVVVGIGAWLAGLLPIPTISIRRRDGVDFLRHAGPLWASSAALTSNQVSDRAVASLVGAGAVSALRYGETVMRVPVNSLGTAWGTVVYPALVRSQSRPDGLGGTASSLIRIVLALAMPVTFGAAALAPLIVDIAYVRGAFMADDARRTSAVVASLAPLFVLSMVQAVVIGSHNARRSGWTLFMAGVAAAVLNLGLDLLLAPVLGVVGIGLSSSLALLFPLSVLIFLLARREAGFHARRSTSVAARSALAAAVPAAIVAWFAWRVEPSDAIGMDVLLFVFGSTAGSRATSSAHISWGSGGRSGGPRRQCPCPPALQLMPEVSSRRIRIAYVGGMTSGGAERQQSAPRRSPPARSLRGRVRRHRTGDVSVRRGECAGVARPRPRDDARWTARRVRHRSRRDRAPRPVPAHHSPPALRHRRRLAVPRVRARGTHPPARPGDPPRDGTAKPFGLQGDAAMAAPDARSDDHTGGRCHRREQCRGRG